MDRLNPAKVRAYLWPAKTLTDILTYAIWWRLFTKAPYMHTRTFIHSLRESRVVTEPKTSKICRSNSDVTPFNESRRH